MKLVQTLAAKLLRAFAKRMKSSFVYARADYPLQARQTRYIDTPQGRARALFYWPLSGCKQPRPVYLNLHGGAIVYPEFPPTPAPCNANAAWATLFGDIPKTLMQEMSSIQASAGSVANVNAVAAGQLESGFSQADVATVPPTRLPA